MNKIKQKGKISLKKNKNNYLCKGIYGLKVLKASLFTEMRFKSLKNNLTRILKKSPIFDKTFQILFHYFPNRPYTKKGILVRCGGGVGNIKYLYVKIPKDSILLEIIPKNKIIRKDINFILIKELKNIIKKYPFLKIINK